MVSKKRKMEMEFGRQDAYEELKGSGASKIFGMYVLAYPGSDVGHAFVNGEEKTSFYDALWKGDIVECLFTSNKIEKAHLEDILWNRNEFQDFFELHSLLPDLRESTLTPKTF